MRKKRRKLKKKNIIWLYIILFFIVGGYFVFNKSVNNLKHLGYTKEEIKTISTSHEAVNIASKKYNDKIAKLMYVDGFLGSNLEKYLGYLDTYNAPLEDVVYLINNDINYQYSNDLMKIVKEEYFIKDNLELYLTHLESDYKNTITNVNTKIIYDYYTNMEKTDLSKDMLMIVNKYYYLDSSYEPEDLEVIDSNYNIGANNRLRHDAKMAFEEMCANALLDNIKLYNVSAYRSYETQERIYNRNVANRGVSETDKYSARPGSSEHQTGLATDINSLDTDFQYTAEYKWLLNNSYKYGFILRYPKDYINVTGYAYEPWHYRYVGKEVAKDIHEKKITFEEYYAYYVEK